MRRTTPAQELAEAIAAKLATAPEGQAVDAVMSLFFTVREQWDDIDVSAFGEAKERWIRQRSIVASMPDRAENWERERQPEAVRVD